jgi:hypothetical protein
MAGIVYISAPLLVSGSEFLYNEIMMGTDAAERRSCEQPARTHLRRASSDNREAPEPHSMPRHATRVVLCSRSFSDFFGFPCHNPLKIENGTFRDILQ